MLILSGAVNTSMIGANGVMNRVAEDGVLVDWFRKPHKRFGTTYRIINLIALLQIADHRAEPRRRLSARRSLRVRRGVELLPEIAGRAGAALPPPRSGIQGAAAICRSAGVEMPVGLGAHHAAALLRGHRQSVLQSRSPPSTASRFTDRPVRRSSPFPSSINARKTSGEEARPGRIQPGYAAGDHGARPCTRVPAACWWRCAITTACRTCTACCEKTNLRRHDIVVMTVRPVSTGAGEYELSDKQLFTDYEKELLYAPW